MNSFVAIDFETANRHRSSVCSVGLVFVEQGIIVDRYYSLIRPTPNYYDSFTTQIHGLCQEDTDGVDAFPKIWHDIKSRIEGLPLVAHNSPFDEGCLRAVLSAYSLPQHRNPFYCTCRRSRQVFPFLPNHKLGTVARHVGYHLEHHHHALADAEVCARIALAVFGN